MSLPAYIERVTEAQSIEELWDMHQAQMAEFGFDRILYGFTRYMTQSSLGDPNDLVILTNHDPKYISHFIDNGLYFHAPMVNWARNNDGAASWDMIRQMESSGALSTSERKVLEFNQKMNVTAGYTVSFKSVSARSKGAIALTCAPGMSQADADEVWARHG
ncbi:MAG: autoinducer binding domain-containing protein, partial [Pseudomonadota bacterium]